MQVSGYVFDGRKPQESQIELRNESLYIYSNAQSSTFHPEMYSLSLVNSMIFNEIVFVHKESKSQKKVGLSSLERREKLQRWFWIWRGFFIIACFLTLVGVLTLFPSQKYVSLGILLGAGSFMRSLLNRYALRLYTPGETERIRQLLEEIVRIYDSHESLNLSYQTKEEKWAFRLVYLYIVAPFTLVFAFFGGVAWMGVLGGYDMELQKDREILLQAASIVILIPTIPYLLWTGWNIFRNKEHLPLTKVPIETGTFRLFIFSAILLVSALPFLL